MLLEDDIGYYVQTGIWELEPLASAVKRVLAQLEKHELRLNWGGYLRLVELCDGELVDVIDFGSGPFTVSVDLTMGDGYVRVL